MPHATKRLPMKFSSTGVLRSLAAGLVALVLLAGVALAVVITLPYSTNFGSTEGYSPGPLPANGDWQAIVL